MAEGSRCGGRPARNRAGPRCQAVLRTRFAGSFFAPRSAAFSPAAFSAGCLAAGAFAAFLAFFAALIGVGATGACSASPACAARSRSGSPAASPRAWRARSTDAIRAFYRLTNGRLPIIGAGGVTTASDAYEKIRAGASLVQLYSALIFRGPRVLREINEGLAQFLQADKLDHIGQAVGADAGKSP